MTTAYKKRVPNTNELAFIQVASNIFAGRILDSKEIEQAVNGSWREIALELLNAYQDDGTSTFWASYDAMANDRPILKDWREMVKVSPERIDQMEKEPVGTLLSDVKPEAIHWLWPGYMALRKLHTFDGDPGLGKSTLLFHLIARLTVGEVMPGEERSFVAGGAVLICLEDGLEDTIQPRLAKAGADLSKVVSIGFIKDKDGKERPFNLAEDGDVLEAAIKRVNAKLVMVDPVMAVLGGKDIYKDNEVRSALAPLKEIAERCNVAIVMIRHIVKGGSDKVIYLGGGSIAFIGLSRIGLLAVRNPDNENQCIFANIKNNLGKPAPKLLYSIVSDTGGSDERPYIRWEGFSTHTDQELMSKPTNVPGEGRQAILKCLKESHPDAMTPQQIADELAPMSIDNVKMTLQRMVKDDQIKKEARGMYVAHSGI